MVNQVQLYLTWLSTCNEFQTICWYLFIISFYTYSEALNATDDDPGVTYVIFTCLNIVLVENFLYTRNPYLLLSPLNGWIISFALNWIFKYSNQISFRIAYSFKTLIIRKFVNLYHLDVYIKGKKLFQTSYIDKNVMFQPT